jgi:hypothetical protein
MAKRKTATKRTRSARGIPRPARPKRAMGERGPRGEHGTRREPGASMHQIVARIGRIEHELELQRKRMAQIERQLDDLRRSPGGVTAPPTDPRPPTTGRLATILARAAARDVK